MSHAGKMKRGEAYWETRDNKGNLPKGITSNNSKMADLNYFQDNKPKPKETKSKGKK